MKLAKWGNGYAVRMPASVMKALELKEGDDIDLHVLDRREFGVSKSEPVDRAEAIRKLRELLKGRLPPDFKFSRDELYDE